MDCMGDVLLQQPECVSLHSGALLGSVCSGFLLGMIAALLIHTLLFKPYCLSGKAKGDPWNLMDVEERDNETEQDGAERSTEPAETVSPTDSPAINDVSAFALKARVIYPINQKYRPLADGASDPSPHVSTSSSSSDWPDESGDEDESVSSGPVHKTHANLTFRRARHYAHTLSYPDDERRLSLLYVTLQNLHQYMARLQKEQWGIFLQIVQALLSADDQLIQQQEKELEKLKRETSGLDRSKIQEPICSIEEVETAGREKLEHTLHTALSFAKQLEQLCHHIQSSKPNDGQEVTHTLINCLLLVEKQLKDIHSNIIQTLWDRQQWWEELSGWLRIKYALMSQEAGLILQLTSQSVEELTADGQLEFDHMEKLINELQSTMSTELQRYTEQVTDHTQQLVSDHCRKIDVRMRKMIKTQKKESHMIQSHDHQDAQQVAKLMAELKLKHWTQRQDFELQQDRRVSDAVCDLWKKLFCNFSESARKSWRECVVSTLTTSSALSEEHSRTLVNNLESNLTNQMQQKESHAHQELQMLREQLEQSKQIWAEQEALATAALNHLGKHNLKVTVAVITRQKDLRDSVAVMEGKQRLLLSDLQHHLKAQHLYNTTLREMTATQLSHADTQSLQQELFSDLEAASELLQSHAQFLIGHALSHNVRLRLGGPVASDRTAADDGQKEQLMKALCDGACISRDSLYTLIMNHCSHLQTVITATQIRPPQQHSQIRERWQKTAECVRSLQRELKHWARKPHSAEFYRRVEQQKQRFLSHCEEEECVCDRIDLQHQTQTISQELQKEEESFLSRLAALTRVPVTHNRADLQQAHKQ